MKRIWISPMAMMFACSSEDGNPRIDSLEQSLATCRTSVVNGVSGQKVICSYDNGTPNTTADDQSWTDFEYWQRHGGTCYRAEILSGYYDVNHCYLRKGPSDSLATRNWWQIVYPARMGDERIWHNQDRSLLADRNCPVGIYNSCAAP